MEKKGTVLLQKLTVSVLVKRFASFKELRFHHGTQKGPPVDAILIQINPVCTPGNYCT
jgi:hypothetical protein